MHYSKLTYSLIFVLATALICLNGCQSNQANQNNAQAKPQNNSKNQSPDIKTGNLAPNFTLPNQHGEKVSLSDYRGKWIVLYFYPADFTPGCTTEACSFRDGIKDFRDIGAVVLGVSPDSTKKHTKFAKTYNLPFTLLSDPSMDVMQRYDATKKIMQNGKQTQRVVRSTVLINPKGIIAYHWPHVKPEGSAKRVAKKLKKLKKQYNQD